MSGNEGEPDGFAGGRCLHALALAVGSQVQGPSRRGGRQRPWEVQ